jgi:two-component system response regulator YesN
LSVIGRAASAKEVGKIVKQKNPGLIIWDIEGQEEQALALVQKVKLQQPQIKVVIINKHLEMTSVRTALHHGIDDYLVKPVTQKELTDSLIRLLFDRTKMHCGRDTVDRALTYMQKNCTRLITLDDVAEKCFISPCYLSRLIKRQTGKTFVQNLQDMRLMRAEWLLLNTNQTVRTIAKSVGFSSDSYFTYVFRSRKGVTPTAFRRVSNSG